MPRIKIAENDFLKWIFPAALTVVTFLFLWRHFPFPVNEEPAAHNSDDQSICRKIRYGFSIQNTTNSAASAELWTIAPIAETSNPPGGAINASHPFDLIQDKTGNRILRFRLEPLPPFSTIIINISADFCPADAPREIGSDDQAFFLAPERYVESDHPVIRSLAATLSREQPMETVKSIFRWVAENIARTGYAGKARGALYAAVRKQGDCTEFMYAFVALCRASGIPARGIGGYICRQDAVLNPAGYHNWAEFYLDGKWEIADPYGGSLTGKRADYVAMKILTGESCEGVPRLGTFLCRGEGLKAEMNR